MSNDIIPDETKWVPWLAVVIVLAIALAAALL